MSSGLRDVTSKFASEDVADIFVRANENFASITDAEAVRLVVLTTNLFRAWEEAFLEKRDGHLDAATWEALSRDYEQPMGAASFRHIWEMRKQNFDPGFQAHVDSLTATEYRLR